MLLTIGEGDILVKAVTAINYELGGCWRISRIIVVDVANNLRAGATETST